MKALLKFFIVSILLLTIGGVVAVFLAVDDNAAVASVSAASVDDAKASYKIVKTLWENLIIHKDPFELTVSENEINGHFVLLNRAIPRVKGHAEINKILNLNITLELPSNPVGKYVNVHCNILPSDRGLVLNNLSVGDLPLPEALSISFAKYVIDVLSGQDLGTIALHAIEAVAINNTQLDVSIAPIPDLKVRLDNTRERFKFLRDTFPQFGDPTAVRFYYQQIMQYDQNTKPGSNRSLTLPIQMVFANARQRSGNPVEENKSAVLALAMFYGSERVGSFIGNVKTAEMKSYIKLNPNSTMKSRNDLARHFIISAALKIISEKEITNAIGEFKELLDARKGGSGFSFVDLAADRAGVKFAEALMQPETAKAMQELLSAGADEALIFPGIYGLPESITQAEFQQHYGNVESPTYIHLVKRIDDCIAELPAYQLAGYSISREINACKF